MKGSPEDIYNALFRQVCSINSDATPLKMMSRRWRKWDDTGVLFPAFFQLELGIEITQEKTPRGFGIQRYVLKANLYFYFQIDIGDLNTPTSPVLNKYFSAIDLVMQPSIVGIAAPNLPPLANVSSRQQLGGRVGIEHAYIDGVVQFDEGLVNPPALLMVPITIITG